MTFEESVKILIERQSFIKKNGLERVYSTLERLDNPQRKFKSIHVTGTNGKGSVCAMFESVLRHSNLKTGLYTSPHLVDITERIKINGKNISKSEFAELFSMVFKCNIDLSFFEIMTCMAFLHFANCKVDIAVIEVGIGGRFDTTNVLPLPELCVITSVDFDHTKILGNTISEIAFQKSGIIKKNSSCVCGKLNKDAIRVIEKVAGEMNAHVKFVENEFKITGYDWDKSLMKICHIADSSEFSIGLLGKHQCINASVVLEGIKILSEKGFRINKRDFETGLKNTLWTGRFQIVKTSFGNNTSFILDGAHNVEAMRSFADTLKDYLTQKTYSCRFKDSKVTFLIGLLMDKDYTGMFSLIKNYLNKIVVTAPDSPRAVDPCVLADELIKIRPDADIEVQTNIEAAIKSASSSEVVAVVGSFYLVGSVLGLLKNTKEANIETGIQTMG